MSKKLIGSFYFKQASSGNLIGEFTNNESFEIMPETAMPTETRETFEGEYNSIWYDIALHYASLKIRKTGKIYKFEWAESNNPSYEGEGMLVDNVLIGYYKMI